jgi:magnesium-transporting ATPase (P-type)
MMTGDHIDTARYIALQAGIINEDDMYDQNVVMSGE